MQKPVKRFLSGMTAVMLAFSCFITKPVSSYASDPDYKSWVQTDSRWGDTPMGYGGATVAGVGCLATSIAILAVHCGAVTSDSFNPGTFVNSMNDLGGFDSSGSLVSWNLVEKAVPGLECVDRYKVPSGTSESEYIEKLRELDEAGYYSICYVGHHWVLVDYIDGDTVYMCDPGSSSTDMLSAYPFNSYTHDTIRYFKYTGSNVKEPDENTDTNPDYSEGIYEITASALNMRENPDSDSQSLALIPEGEKISISEFSNGWGKTFYEGSEGWVSMEYVVYSSSDIVTDTPATTESSQTTTVATSTESTSPETYTNEYTVISETAEITDCSGENVICTIPEKSVVKVKSINDDRAEILFGDSSAIICLKDIAPIDDTASSPQKGDINNDGYIDKLDISALNEYMLTERELPDKISIFTEKGRYAADWNDDGAVDNDDVIQLLIEICSQ